MSKIFRLLIKQEVKNEKYRKLMKKHLQYLRDAFDVIDIEKKGFITMDALKEVLLFNNFPTLKKDLD